MPKNMNLGAGITERSGPAWDMTGNTPGDVEAGFKALLVMGDANAQYGIWGAAVIEIRETCEAILADKDRDARFAADSPECFARRILHSLKAVDNAIGEDAIQWATKSALQVGVLWASLNLSVGWGKRALGKKKQEDSQSKAAEARRQKAAEDPPAWWDDVLRDAITIRKKFSSYKRSRIAKILAGNFYKDDRGREKNFSQRQISTVLKRSGFN